MLGRSTRAAGGFLAAVRPQWRCQQLIVRRGSSASGALLQHRARTAASALLPRARQAAGQNRTAAAVAAGLAAGTAITLLPWAMLVARCDDDDDDEPMTPEQQAAAARIDALNMAASKRTLTPMMTACMAAGLTWPLSMSIRSGTRGIGMTVCSLVCTAPVLYAVVGLATRSSESDVATAMESAKSRELPTRLLMCLLAGFVFPALQVTVATGEIATGLSAVLTGLAGSFGLFFSVVDTAGEARREEGW